MIAAVTRIQARPGQRARNIAALLEVVQLAAEHTPAPDLIVLPDCRGSALTVADPSLQTVAMNQAFVEAIAWQAREWGLWIALGHEMVLEERIVGGATLFDPDGDAYLRHPPLRHPPFGHPPPLNGPASGDGLDSPPAWVVRPTPLGVVALVCGPPNGDAFDAAPPGDVPMDLPIDLAIVAAAAGLGRPLEQGAAVARSTGCWVCLVTPALAPPGRGEAGASDSVIMDREGRVVARAEGNAPAFAVAVLDIDPPPAEILLGCDRMEDVEDVE